VLTLTIQQTLDGQGDEADHPIGVKLRIAEIKRLTKKSSCEKIREEEPSFLKLTGGKRR